MYETDMLIFPIDHVIWQVSRQKHIAMDFDGNVFKLGVFDFKSFRMKTFFINVYILAAYTRER